MNKNILKYFGLAALLALGATTSVSAAVTPEGLEAAIKAAADGDTIELAEGEFTTYGTVYAQNRTLTFVGAGIGKTIWKYGASEHRDGEHGSDYSWSGATLSFKGITFTDNFTDTSYYRGFCYPAALSFESCKFTHMIGYWGKGPVVCKGCLFEPDSKQEYCVKVYSGSSFIFDDCTFKAHNKGFIQLYMQDGGTTVHDVIVKDCKFEKIFSGSNKTAVYFYDQGATEGARWSIDFQGENINVNESLSASETSGTWLWGDMKYNDAGTAVMKVNGATVFANNQKVDPVANVVEVISADGTTTKGYPTLAEAFAATPWVEKPVNGCTVRLLADIDLAGVAWTPVSFCGTFDGNNKTISNLKVQDTTGKAGFFGTFRGTARDVTFEAADVTGSNYAAVFAAEVSNSGGASDSYLEMLIENVTVKNSVVKGVQKCGGVIGRFPESDGSIEIRGCLVDTLSILGKDPEGVWQAGGLVGYLQTMIAANAYIHDNTVKNITIADANVEYFKTSGFAHDFFSSAFIGDVINYKKLNEGGSKDGTVILEKNTVAGTNGGYQIGPNSNTYIGDYRMQDEVGGSVEKVCKIEVDGVDITIPASPEVVPEKPTAEKVEEATKVVDESGAVVTPTQEQEAAAKTEVDKVVESFDNPEIAKVEKTGVTEAAMTVTGEGEEQKVVVKSAIVEELQKAAPQGTSDQITSESDVKSYVKVALNEAKVAVKDETAALKSVTFDVKPMAETTVTVGQEKTVVIAQIPNEEIAQPITFRLPLTDAFTVSAIVTHEGDPDRLCMVQGAAGGRYVEVTASHFSLFTATPSEIVETTTESKTILGIKRVDYTVTQSTDDLAAAVPWLKAANADMPVSQLITTGLTDGDQIQVYDLEAKTYYSWHYNGTAWTADQLSDGTTVPSADSYVLKRGRAFWYKPVGGKGASGTYTQVGLYSEASITSKVDSATVESASFAKPVHFLMASPKYEVFNLKEKLTKAAGCRADDVVVIVATGARYRFNGTVWGQDIDQEVKIGRATVTQKAFVPTEGDISVPAGTAFWYLSAGGAPEFEW